VKPERISDLPYGYEVRCNRVNGWQLWYTDPQHVTSLVGGEFDEDGIILQVGETTVVDSLNHNQPDAGGNAVAAAELLEPASQATVGEAVPTFKMEVGRRYKCKGGQISKCIGNSHIRSNDRKCWPMEFVNDEGKITAFGVYENGCVHASGESCDFDIIGYADHDPTKYVVRKREVEPLRVMLRNAQDAAVEAIEECGLLRERAEKAEKEIERLNQMLRDTGYGQGQIDAYAESCDEIETMKNIMQGMVERATKAEARVKELESELAKFVRYPAYTHIELYTKKD
jgi:hypothetical protein